MVRQRGRYWFFCCNNILNTKIAEFPVNIAHFSKRAVGVCFCCNFCLISVNCAIDKGPLNGLIE